ncbi:MAG: divalent-cation tolerance protein CutA [Candidatus Hecatellaceae archaeon]
MQDLILVLTTAPDRASAEKLAEILVNGRLAACCSIIPGVTSTYWWEGKAERSEEVLLLVKTSRSLYRRVEAEIKQNHPYRVPEIVALKVEAVLPEYWEWVKSSVEK